MQTQLKWKLGFALRLFHYQGHNFPASKSLTQLMQILNIRGVLDIFEMAAYYQNTQQF